MHKKKSSRRNFIGKTALAFAGLTFASGMNISGAFNFIPVLQYKEKLKEGRKEKLKSKIIHNLTKALKFLEDNCGTDGIQKVVILLNGKVVFEGGKHDIVQPSWSCTKSFTSTILGLLISDEKCSLDDKVCQYLSELTKHYPDLTFRHFATMTSGYRAIGDEPRGNYIHGPSLTPHLPSPDPLFSPGTKFQYWDSAMNMFAYALTKVAGESLKEIFKQRIADPIGMDSTKWDWKAFEKIGETKVCGGAGNNGWGVSISATEFAKFGQLLLQKGKWNGQSLLPEEWIEAAGSPQIKNLIPNDSTAYGFNWWTAGTLPDAPKGTFAAMGFNNNKCFIVPEWDMVIVRLGLDGNVENEVWNDFFKRLSGDIRKEVQ